jgi:putative DNA primase/helicase
MNYGMECLKFNSDSTLPKGAFFMSSMTDPKKCSNKKPSLGERDLTAVEHRTDNQLATWFVDRYYESIRFVTSWDEWLVWDGKRWGRDPSDTAIMRMARRFSQSLWNEMADVSTSHTKDAAYFCTRANNTNGIKAYINQARSDERITIHHDQLDNHYYLLNLPSGTLNLETGEHYDHRQSDLLTKLATVDFDEIAECPRWLKALNIIFDGNQQLIHYVQQLLGYALTGDSGEALLPVAYGSGCNGKSTITDVMLNILGEYASPAMDSLLLGDKNAHPTEKAMLHGLRFVTVSETAQGALLKESRVKELTGEQFIIGRRMNEDFWSFPRTHKTWMNTNHLPLVRGTDDGIWRRIKVIPFLVDIRKVTTPIPGFVKQLVETEAPGILNWLLRGFQDYQQNGFHEPDCVRLATSNYRGEEDEIGHFIDEECLIDNHRQCLANALYTRYLAWGGKQTQTSFGRQIDKRGYQKQKETKGDNRNKTVYYGLSLVSESTDSSQVDGPT